MSDVRRLSTILFAAAFSCFVAQAAEAVRGAYPILTTPYLADGAVDYEALVKEAEWTDAAGVNGIIWPQSDDSIDLLTMDEKKRGMFALAPMLAEIWRLMEAKDESGALDAAYAKYLLAINLMQTVPGDLRGYQLVFFKEKGIFKTTVSRVCVDKDKAPYAWKLDVLEVDGGVRAEIMRRCSVEGH